MKIVLWFGHNTIHNGTFDSGSVGNGKKEADITKATVYKLAELLNNMGHDTYIIDVYKKRFNASSRKMASKKAHQYRADKTNQINPDICLDIHVNSGGGTGPECWVYSTNSKSYPWARKIVNSIAKETGLRNRGVRVNSSYWSLSMTKCPTIIVEGGFIDSKKDMDILTPDKYALSIAKAFGQVKEEAKISNEPSKWAKDSWQWGIDKGLTDGNRPKDNATREEVVTMLKRLYKSK